jgi:glycosyltransferase involved in cell wall biosynthesis
VAVDFDFSKEPGKRQLIRGINAEGIPLVSIITPYYNAGKYFEQTYNCVMNQTFPWFEWIIVDDGSSEQKDIQILKDFAGKDNRIKIFHKENGGIASARNLGIKNSCTEIIIPLDADDLIKPTFVETVYWGLYFNSESAWCYTDSVGFQDDTYLWKKTFSPSVMKTDNQLVCTAGIRKGKLFDCGCYKEGVKHFNEDWMLWLKMLSKSYFPVHISEYGFWYRRTDGGVLHIVKSDSGVIRTNKQLISETASEVDTTVQAKEYPCANAPGKYIKPKLSDWGRRVFKTHDKIHVMMLLPWMEMGGADLFNLDVVRKIDKNKYEMSILTTVPASNSWQQRFEEYVTDIFNLPNFLDVQNYAEFISYFIKSREIDVLFLSNSYYGYYLLPWLRKEFPDLAIIDYVHMEEWYWRNGGYARTSGALGEILEKTYVCNERTRQVLINDFGREPESVETLYIGVDKDKFDESKVEAGLAKKMLGIESDRPVILFPCRIHPQKRPFLMLEIAKEVKKKITNIAFVVVGDGSQLEELKIKAKEASLSDTVYFADRQNDMLPFYKDAGITLICSLKEGLALTAYESLSMSTPVITSDVGGQSELIDDSVGAVLPLMQSEVEGLDEREFSQEEVSQYVQAVENILKDRDKYETMCKACRNRIEKNFSSDIMIRKLQDILDNLVHDDALKNRRRQTNIDLLKFGNLVDDHVTVFNEVETYQNMYKNTYGADAKNELMRLANSKWGSRLIKLVFKLKLNRLFR